MIRDKLINLHGWYKDVVFESGLSSHGLVQGTFNLLPLGTFVWGRFQYFLDKAFSEHQVNNVLFPSMLPKLDFQKEKNSLGNLSDEIYAVEGDLFLRPTSEIMFCHYFKQCQKLPVKVNQWCSVFRKEHNTKMFLRNNEFWWQELHAVFKESNEASEFASLIHNIYLELITQKMCLHVLNGFKTVNDRFCGAKESLCCECILPDGQCLQLSTSHFLDQSFVDIYEVSVGGVKPFQISAGCSTRLLGALVMCHGDSKGLVLPPFFSKIRVIYLGEATENYLNLTNLTHSIEFCQLNKKGLGFRLTQSEIEGVWLNIVVGNQEISEKKVLLYSRIDLPSWGGRKTSIAVSELSDFVLRASVEFEEVLTICNQKYSLSKISEQNQISEVKAKVEGGGVVLCPWFDDAMNEQKFKECKLGFGPRCIESRIERSESGPRCFFSGELANCFAYFGRSY